MVLSCDHGWVPQKPFHVSVTCYLLTSDSVTMTRLESGQIYREEYGILHHNLVLTKNNPTSVVLREASA